MHLNINILLPKIDELRHMARFSNAAVIGISVSKFDRSVTNQADNCWNFLPTSESN